MSAREMGEIIDRNVKVVELQKMQIKNVKHYLSPRAKKEDVATLDLGRCGLTHEAIAEAVGTTPGKVAYRLKMAGIRTSDYRRGTSELAKQIIKYVVDDSAKYFETVVSNLKRYLKD